MRLKKDEAKRRVVEPLELCTHIYMHTRKIKLHRACLRAAVVFCSEKFLKLWFYGCSQFSSCVYEEGVRTVFYIVAVVIIIIMIIIGKIMKKFTML